MPRQAYPGGIYRIETSLTNAPALYIGGARNEQHRVECWVLRPNRGQYTKPVYDRTMIELDRLRTVLEDEGQQFGMPDYYVVDGSVTAQAREATDQDAIYMVGHFSCSVDFDRDPDIPISTGS